MTIKSSTGYGSYIFKIEILNQEITVGKLRRDLMLNKAYLEICFPSNNNASIKINTKNLYTDDVLEKAKKIIFKKMYLSAEQILCSLKKAEMK